jgi:hypothetical protein
MSRRWPEAGSHISTPALPALRKFPVWQTRHPPERPFLPQFLLTLDFWQKHFVPVLGTIPTLEFGIEFKDW